MSRLRQTVHNHPNRFIALHRP
ncbi:hypothetical protein A2U01_0091474, partial [Trifolium medium]|nr:hypothetical protein [Trifolium medium]